MNRKNRGGLKWAILLALSAVPAAAGSDIEAVYPAADAFLGEQLQENEVKSAARLTATLEKQIRTQYRPGGARRDAHPKAHGCVAATFAVHGDLAPEFRHGVFQSGATYPAKIRFSNGSPNAAAPDIKGDTRGMAIKLFQVPGEKLFAGPGREDEQDFILISSPFFFINDAEAYADFFEALQGGVWQRLRIPFILGWTGSYNAYKMLAQKIPNPVQARYWSVVPYQLGRGDTRRAVKYSARPCGAGADALPEAPSADYLRKALVRTLAAGEVCMEFMIQSRAPDMSVEDSITEWSEERAPFHPVARLTIHRQVFDTPEQNALCENEVYNPWHALPEHKPLGAVGRVRRVVYEAISRLRHEMNSSNQENP